jgi:serine/threonine protein kinase
MIGTSLNQYRIIASIGAGGMGEVFRARDTRLNRDVAVKVLPKDFASDADRLRRFEQEAKTLAALNHPNILTIHDAGVHEGAPYLVSELLRGQTLREVLGNAATTALPVRKATDYALQIAQGLAAAHGKGVIHRDLKPENIFVTQDGRVKILDFGLAKLRENPKSEIRNPKSSVDAEVSTVVQPVTDTTEPGMVLGTPAYMAPEQVRGEPADHRADIFAFGCALYEMLSGTRVFRRDTLVASMNAVLSEEPPELSVTNPNLPVALERVVRRCLEKQPDNRFQSAKDLAFAVEMATEGSQKRDRLGVAPPRSSATWKLALAGGRRVAFMRWPEESGSELYVSGIDGSAETLLHRFPAQRGSSPRWSPDGETIAVPINDSGRPQSLVLVNVRTRQVRTLAAPHPYNQLSAAAWDGAGRHLYYLQAVSPSALVGQGTLYRQRVDSGRCEELLRSPAHCRTLEWHPSGNVLFDARSPRENLKELRLDASTNAPRSLTLGNSTDRQPAYSPDGEDIVFSSNRSGNLDLWSISRKTEVVRRLTDDPATDWDPCFSPDGKQLVWSSSRSGNLEVWIGNADGTAPVQVTRDGFAAENPTMTRDGRWIVYGSAHPEKGGIWKIHPDGTVATRLVQGGTVGNAEVSPDGRYAAYVENVRSALVSIKVVEVESGAPVSFKIQVEALKETIVILGRVRWMPDGKSLVFLGQNQAGVNGVYIQDFVPGKDTTNTRRPLVGFDPENSAESFGISPDGRSITIAAWEQFFSIMVTEGLPAQ